MNGNKVVFHREDGQYLVRVGTLDFSGDSVVFEGDFDESAKVFLETVSLQFYKRLEEEFEKGRTAATVEALTGQFPSKVLISADTIDAAIDLVCDDDGKVHDGVLWIGDCKDEDGTSVYGLHLANFDDVERGSITLTDLPKGKRLEN